MTERDASGSPPGGQGSKMQAAREQTAKVRQSAAHAGGGMAQTVAGQGKEVAAETGRQAHNLLGETSSQLKHQATAQQKRAAEGLRALGDELQSMSSKGERPGVATDLVRGASGTVHQAADWLEQREPGTVVNELRDYARRHPGMFLAGAAVAGMLAGRLTRNLAVSGDGGSGPAPAPSTPQPNIVPATEPAPEPEPTGRPQDLPGDERMPESGRVPHAYTEER